MDYKKTKEQLNNMLKDNHKNFIKSIISIEKGIDDQDKLNRIYDLYMRKNDFNLLNDKIDFIILEDDKILRNLDIEFKSEKEKLQYIEKLISNKGIFTKSSFANKGYGLDILIKDKDSYVRKAVARQGYRLDILINDESPKVRAEVAKQGYGLDKLINDEVSFVRAAVARQNYGLDLLVNDNDSLVRKAVARQGYGLDKLVNDEDEYVREMALRVQKALQGRY